MAIIERKVLITGTDANGNLTYDFPITSAEFIEGLHAVAKTGDYTKLVNKPSTNPFIAQSLKLEQPNGNSYLYFNRQSATAASTYNVALTNDADDTLSINSKNGTPKLILNGTNSSIYNDKILNIASNNGNVNITSNNKDIVISAINGKVYIKNNSDINGDTIIRGKLDTLGQVAITGGTTINGAITCKSTINATGNISSGGTVSATNLTATTNLNTKDLNVSNSITAKSMAVTSLKQNGFPVYGLKRSSISSQGYVVYGNNLVLAWGVYSLDQSKLDDIDKNKNNSQYKTYPIRRYKKADATADGYTGSITNLYKVYKPPYNLNETNSDGTAKEHIKMTTYYAGVGDAGVPGSNQVQKWMNSSKFKDEAFDVFYLTSSGDAFTVFWVGKATNL